MPSLHRRSSAPSEGAAAPAPTIQYVTDGHAAPAPAGSGVRDALAFGHDQGHMAMLLFANPSRQQVADLAEVWQLHPLLEEDLVNASQRPKIERYGDTLFIVARSAHYDDAAEEVDLAEFHLLVRPGAIAVLCQDGRWVDGTPSARFAQELETAPSERDRALLDDRDLLRLGPEAVMYRILDTIVDGYRPVLEGIATDLEEIEKQVFTGDPTVAERIYRLSREVIDVQHACTPLTAVIEALRGGFRKHGIADELQAYLQDVSDHLARVDARAGELRESLAQILSVNATLVGQRQNTAMQKISGWAAIALAPTIVAGIYGMNFDDMPELHWAFGYPFAICLMVGLSVALYAIFKKSKWM
ncbi:magnesium and cobalt transport protein CorA [Demequina sp. NBRC 110057]|uniref:magnesium and cobalt transport protein CorA n=1 Tax=Demequina sp. NBRC 110057 TaxID=1570346 RepID=UPI000A04503F|nr:magnesium and cobalt transport protein CorA [Demequina sp. NBRC 110057]